MSGTEFIYFLKVEEDNWIVDFVGLYLWALEILK